jgi:hypothetical protein
MKRVFALLLINVVFVQFIFAKQSANSDSTATLKPSQLAFYYVRHLSSGALLVSLQERAMGIASLRKMGYDASANQIIKQQLLQNKIIVNGFRKRFNYCPVYFFYNTNNDSVLAGHTNGIFLDTNLVVDPTIKLRESFFLVAEEGDMEMADQATDEDSANAQPVATYTVRSGGILVMDSRFKVLHSPFPYFTEYSTFNKFGKAVEKLNERLTDIYPYKQR